MLKKVVQILLIIFFCTILSFYLINKIAESKNQNKNPFYAYCNYVKYDNVQYCYTNGIRYNNIDITFKDTVSFKTTDKNILRENIDEETLKFIQKEIQSKVLENSLTIQNKNKRELIQKIINYNCLKPYKSKFEIADTIFEISRVTEYILKSKDVKEIKNIPSLKFLKNKNISYAAVYENSVTNFYSSTGELVLRTYAPNNNILRYQIFDSLGNFYTYDNNQNLVEYSNGLNVYDKQNKLLYTYKIIDDSKIRFITNSKPKFKTGVQLVKELNNTKSDLYISLSKFLDQHYDKGSSYEMIDALNNYLADLKQTNRKLYDYYYNAAKLDIITLCISKNNKNYVFSINNYNQCKSNSAVASMAETASVYHGKCAEINLKSLKKNNLDGKYFYNVKITETNGKIVCKPNPPCKACSINTSLWSWIYPSK